MSDSTVFLNQTFYPERQTRIPILTHALQYGTGVFEGIRGYRDGQTGEVLLFRASDHFERMRRSATFMNIRLPLPTKELVQAGAELVQRNHIETDVFIRAVAFKSAITIDAGLPDEDAFAMVAVPMRDERDVLRGLHCGVSPWRRPNETALPCRAKVCGSSAYAALATHTVREQGFDEAIVLNEAGHVAEGSAQNVFLVRDGRLITPDVSQGIFEGITRGTVITLAKQGSVAIVEERLVDRAELDLAEEIFLCSTEAQITPVTRIDGRTVGSGSVGPVTLRLQADYGRLVRGAAHAREGWLFPVYGFAGVACG